MRSHVSKPKPPLLLQNSLTASSCCSTPGSNTLPVNCKVCCGGQPYEGRKNVRETFYLFYLTFTSLSLSPSFSQLTLNSTDQILLNLGTCFPSSIALGVTVLNAGYKQCTVRWEGRGAIETQQQTWRRYFGDRNHIHANTHTHTYEHIHTEKERDRKRNTHKPVHRLGDDGVLVSVTVGGAISDSGSVG